MAETEGKLLTCDLCGATVFLKYVKTKDYDGGFTRVMRNTIDELLDLLVEFGRPVEKEVSNA